MNTSQISFKLFNSDFINSAELDTLNQVTQSIPRQTWYGRENFLKDTFVAKLVDSEFLFSFSKSYICLPVIEKIAAIFLKQILDLHHDPIKMCIFESTIDRNTVTKETEETSHFFWHRDSICLENRERTPVDYTLIFLLNQKIWDGGNLLLQKGGNYIGNSYQWQGSETPIIEIPIGNDKAIIFKNIDCGHAVTALKVKENDLVHRDVFILTCKILS
ncbi:hypothetical protein BN1013_00612 [Candidatus Rubidus massiliensis]|nr:hypothetical protein BN1013_00612 [Candidatus Rubidus massiliensis]